MHFHLPFAVGRMLWTFTFAAQLVLLVVILGRDRFKRFPWFTASIALFALRLLAEVLLSGRIAIPVLQITFITLADLTAIVGLLVVVEIARRAFSGVSLQTWFFGAFILLAVGGLVIAFWGPWPARGEWIVSSPMAALKLMQIGAQKADMLVDILTVQLGLAIVLFGRRFHSGWRSHPQRLVIGLSTVAISWLSVEGIWQIIARTAHPHSRQEYERILDLGNKLVNANKVIYIAALLWWIACLWRDEPGTPAVQPASGPLQLPEFEAAEDFAIEADHTGRAAG